MKAKKQIKKIFGDGVKVSKEKEVKPYQAKDKKDYEYRSKMYNDSLDLHNYTKYQYEKEGKSKPVFDEILDTGFVGIFSNNRGDRQYNKDVYNYAEKLTKKNKNIKIGLPTGPFGKSTIHTKEEYKKAGSTDVYHDKIKPTGYWIGDAVNAVYSEPKQKILPPIEKKEQAKTTPAKKTIEVKKSTPVKPSAQKAAPVKPVVKKEAKSESAEKVNKDKKQTYRDTVAINRIYNQSYGSHGLIDEKGKVTWDRPATAKEKAEAKKTPKMANGGKVTKKKKK